MSSLPIESRGEGFPLRFNGSGAGEEAAPGLHPGEGNPLTAAHLHQLEMASKRVKPIEKAVRYAHFSGWTTLLAGALSVPFAIGNLPMLIFALALAGIGTRELSLRRGLRALEATAPGKLATNQLMLGGVLIAYAVFMLVAPKGGGMVESALGSDPMLQSSPELGGVMDQMVQLEKLATSMLYVAMILLAVFIQGGTALYYRVKGSRLRKFHRETPHWVALVYSALHR